MKHLHSVILTYTLILFTLSLFLLSPVRLSAQWEQTNGPYGGGSVTSFTTDNEGSLFASVREAGIFKSTNQGVTWQDISNEMFHNSVHSIIHAGDGILFAADAGVMRSLNNGNSWERLQNELSGAMVTSLAANDSGYLYAAVGEYYMSATLPGIYKSTDNGNTWSHVYNDENYPENPVVAVNSNGTIFYGSWEVLRSDDGGVTWSVVSPPVPSYYKVNALTFDTEGNIYCGTAFAGGVYRSNNNGDTWEELKTWYDLTYVEAIAVEPDNDIFVSMYGTVYRSVDGGATWDSNFMDTNYDIVSFMPLGNKILAGGRGVYSSTDNGTNWTETSEGITGTAIASIALTSSGKLFANDGYNLWRSDNQGETWTDISSAFEEQYFEKVKYHTTGLYVISGGNIFRSVDEGVTWTLVFNRELSFWGADDFVISDEGSIFVITWQEVWSSPDLGLTWEQENLGSNTFTSIGINSSGTIVVFLNYSHINYRSLDNGETWLQITTIPMHADGMHSVVSDSLNHFYVANHSSIYKSEDEGETWTVISAVEYGSYITLCMDHNGNLYTDNDTLILQSNDGGLTWTDFFTEDAPYDKGFNCFVSGPSSSWLFAGHPGRGVWRISNVTESIPYYAHKQSDISIYPNPARESATINYPGYISGTQPVIEIYAVNGFLVDRQIASGHETRLNTTNLTKGIYLVKLANEVKQLVIY